MQHLSAECILVVGIIDAHSATLTPAVREYSSAVVIDGIQRLEDIEVLGRERHQLRIGVAWTTACQGYSVGDGGSNKRTVFADESVAAVQMASGGLRKRWCGEDSRDKGCGGSDEGEEPGHFDVVNVVWVERVGRRRVRIFSVDVDDEQVAELMGYPVVFIAGMHIRRPLVSRRHLRGNNARHDQHSAI